MTDQPTLKAILFDMDDTLIDWSGRQGEWEDYRRSHLEQVFQYVHANVRPFEAPAAMEDFIAGAVRSIEEAWIKAGETGRAPHFGQNIVRALEGVGVPADSYVLMDVLHAYDWGPVEGVVVFQDALEVLPTLRAADLTLGVITNSSQPMWMRDIELREFGLINFINGPRFSAADVGWLKPHSSIFRKALDTLQLDASEVVFVGDNPLADINGAQSVGMKAVLRYLSNGYNRVHETTPDGEIETLHDLLPILDSWYPGWRESTPSSEQPA